MLTSKARRGRGALPLTARFLIAFVAASLLPLIAVGTFQIANSYSVQFGQVQELQREAAKRAAMTIDAYLRQMEDELALTAREWSLRDEEARPALLGGLLAHNPGFETLTMMDSAGFETAKVSRYTLFGPDDLLSRADSPAFVYARHGERYLGPILVSQYGEPLATLSIPVRNVLGEVSGVLSGEVNLKYMWDIIARMEIGRNGYAYVVDDQGRLIAHRDPALVLQGRDLSNVEGVRNGLLGEETVRTYVGLGGQRVIGQVQPMQEASWFVLVEAPTRQAMADIYGTVITGVVALAVALGASAILGWSMARIVVRPVRALREGAEIMGSGDLSHRIDIRSSDEIGALADTFNAMAAQLQDMIGTLEQRVTDRTQELEHRAVQLATAADVGRAAASILELEALAHEVVRLVRGRFGLYYAGLFLLDEAGRYAVLEAGTGEAGRIMAAEGHSLEVGGVSMVGSACALGQARIALGVGAEPVRFDNPLLPDTRSEMALPLLVGDRVLGALDVQSTEPDAFSEEDIAVLQLVADQVAVAVDNALKLSEEAALLEATSPIFRMGRQFTEAMTTTEVTQVINDSIAQTEADACAVAWFGFSRDGRVETITFIGEWNRNGASRVPVGVALPASAAQFPLPVLTGAHAIENVADDEGVLAGARQALVESGMLALLSIPLQAADRVVGSVIVQRATPGPFSDVSMRLYETLADQAAVALERAQLVEESQRRAASERLTAEIGARMRETLDIETILKVTAQEIRQALALPEVIVRLEPPPPGSGDKDEGPSDS